MSLFNSFTLTVKRYTGNYVRGKWVKNEPPTIFQIQTSWQPATGSDLEALEEGLRQKTIYKIYPTTQLLTVNPINNSPADIIIGPDGYNYDVVMVGNYQNNIINHYKCMVARKKEGE